MTGPLWVDLVLLALLVAGAVAGWRRGGLRLAGSVAGLVVGLAVGLAVVPALAADLTGSTARLVEVVGVLLVGALGSALGRGLGGLLATVLARLHLSLLDRAAGAVGGLVLAAVLVGAGLALLDPQGTRRAVDSVAWSTVLLIAGVLTYVGVLQAAGTIDLVSDGIAGLGVPLLAALLICYLGGIASAFASSVAMLGVMVPLALPFLQQGDIGPIGFVAALAVATTVVDVSPFSTNGALVLANAPAGTDRDRFYKRMLGYAGTVTALGPLLAWAVFVLPGWG